MTLMEPPTATEPRNAPRETTGEDGVAEKRELTTADMLATLRELGPTVSTLAITSLTLPGVMGMFVLFSVVALVGEVALLIDLSSMIDPAGTATFIAIASVGYAIVMSIATGSMLAPTYATATLAGALFGLMSGSVVAMVGVTGGALIGYFLGVALARGRVMDVIQRHERASVIHRAIIERNAVQEGGVVALIRIPPNSPFALTNLLMSSTSVRLLPYAIGTAIGIAPRTIIAVWVGATIRGAAEEGGSPWWTVAKIVIGLVVFILVYRILVKWAREALRELEVTGDGAP